MLVGIPKLFSVVTALCQLACLFAMLITDAWAITAPGSEIRNQAVLTYQGADGEVVEVLSNISTISVSEYFAFSLSSAHQVGVTPGNVHSFAHQIHNNGNVTDEFGFTARVVGPDGDLLPVTTFVSVDLNGNGIADGDELQIDGIIPLNPGDSLDLVVTVSVPDDAMLGSTYTVALSAENSGGETTSVNNIINVETGAVFSLIKAAGPGCHVSLFPGDEVSHEVDIVNKGNATVDGINLLLDGERLAGIVVQQPVPSLMRFSRFEPRDYTSGARPVVRLSGVAENSWISADQWDQNAVVVSAGLLYERGTFGPQSQDYFKIFTVVDEIDSNIKMQMTSAQVDIDGDRSIEFESNRTCHTYSVPGAARQAQLRFVEPSQNVYSSGRIADFNNADDFSPAVHYVVDAEDESGYNTTADGFYLELELTGYLYNSANIHFDGNKKRYIETVVESSLTGDQVTVLMLETNTAGLFRSISPVKLSQRQRSNGGYCPALPDASIVLAPRFESPADSCVLASTSDDELLARYLDSERGFTVAEVALVNPRALVFNAQTGLPVAGARVMVKEVVTGEVVTNRITGLPVEITTTANGFYTIPRLDPSKRYYLDVVPPQSHSFPSQARATDLRTFYIDDSSYGLSGAPDGNGDGSFSVASAAFTRPVDVPLDSAVDDTLLVVEKQAQLREVEIGQLVPYTVTIKNLDSANLRNVELLDTPPYGYRYVPMSATLDGEVISDPDIASDGGLSFSLGSVEPDEVITISYSLRVTAAAVDSDGVNQAQIRGVSDANAQVVSPLSRVGVRLRKRGVLSDRAALFGKIYVDQDCDGLQSDKEWPIGGVRFYLQDGTYTVSDADGLFSLYGLAPGSHILKVDNHTLPRGLTLKPLDSNQAVDGRSRFVDLMAGDFHRADFAALCPRSNIEELFTEIKARNESINSAWLLKDVAGFEAGEELPAADPGALVTSLDGDLSNGLLTGPGRDSAAANISRSPELIKKITASQKIPEQPLPDPKKIVSQITQQQAKDGTWLWPTSELSVRGRFMAVVRDGIEPTLYVNNQPVAASQIGERLANRREKAQIVAWYGVELRDGENTVEVKGIGPFGNERVLATGVFKKPSSGASIRISPTESTIAADGGRTALPVNVEVLDAQGYPALGAYFVTLESSDGAWLEEDIQDSEPGKQVRIDSGVRQLHYVSSAKTGEVVLRVSTGAFSDEVTIQQLTESRPLIVAGLLEAGATISSASYGEFKPSRPLAGLDGNSRLHSRAAVFAKGRVKGKFNLTLSYDSDKESATELLRDINPALHYPVHGDSSVRGFEAQSRSKLYVKVEEDQNSIMWGDFLTDSASDHEDLARSRRTLTGFNTVIDSEVGRFRLFASRQQDMHVSEEVAGNGSAMLYRLESYPIVPNSEVVELVTRSRDNEGLVIARSRLSRFNDYTIDPVYGYITFSTVIPTLDDQQNPVSVQIAYDVEKSGANYWVTGVRFDREIGDHLQFGVSHTNDHDSQSGITHTGAYATYKAGKNTSVSASVAGSRTVDGSTGNASRLAVDHRWSEDSRTTLTYARADAQFQNSGASVASGRSELRLNHKQTIDNKTSVVLDALQSESLTNSDGRTTLGAQIEHRLRDWLLRAGLRQVSREEFASKEQFVTATMGLNRQIVVGGKSGQIEAELEQDTGQSSRRRVRLGGKLQVHEKARVYSNYELANSLLALNGSSNNQKTEILTIGVDSDVLPSTRLYSEYRMRGAFDGRDHETASGLRADIEVEPNLRISPNIEFIKNADTGDSLAASIGVVDTRNENSRRQLRVETRQAESSDYLGLRASYAARMNEDWTGVFTENLSKQDNLVGENSLRHSFVAGLSRRPKLDNKHHMLLMYNWKEESGVSAGVRRSVHLLSTHQNLQLNNRALVSGRLGGKHHSEKLKGQATINGFSMLADLRVNYDFNRRLNLDVRGGVLATDGMSELRYSAGAGLYYVLNKNARLGIAYNFGGFRDEDLDAEEFYAHGWRFGLQYKFDEDSLKWLE